MGLLELKKIIVVIGPSSARGEARVVERSELGVFVCSVRSLLQWIGADALWIVSEERRLELFSAFAEKGLKDFPSIRWVARGKTGLKEIGPVLDQERGDLLILSYSSEDSPWQRVVLETSRVPLLVLPEKLQLQSPPFRSIMVPISGEHRMSPALTLAVRLGNAANLGLDLIHFQTQARARISIVLDREYPHLIEEVISQGCPLASLRDRLVIRRFRHLIGDPISGLQRAAADRGQSLLVVEWKGCLDPGRAQRVRKILSLGTHPLLLVREVEDRASRLKVGKFFERAA